MSLRVLLRRGMRLVTVAALGAFGWMVVREVREGLAPHEVGVEGEPLEESENVVSSGIRMVQVDERGRPIAEIRAEESVTVSGPEQRFRGVSVRFIGTHGEEDTLVEAEELLLDVERESFQFLGHVRFSSVDLELAGPHLQLRRNPDRLWASEPMLVRTGAFHGVASSLDFSLTSGLALLRGLTMRAEDPDGIAATADLARVERPKRQGYGSINLGGDVEVSSPGFRLLSARSVDIRRDPDDGRVVGLSSGFDTTIEVRKPSEPEAMLTVLGDEVEMELDSGRRPQAIRVAGGARLSVPGNAEAQGETAETRFDDDGDPESLHLVGDVRTRVAAPESDAWMRIEARAARIGFHEDASLGDARYWGGVEIVHEGVRATAAGASWDGVKTFSLSGGPRIEDSALLELQGEDLRIEIGAPGRVAGEDGVAGRLLAGKADWLPGSPEGVSILGDRAEIETGTGRARFSGAVRMAFGESRLNGGALRLDAETQTFVMDGGVDSALRFGDDDGEDSISFSIRSETLRHGAGGLAYSGNPVFEHRSGDAGNRLEAQRILAEVDAERNLSGIVGSGEARFERGTSRVQGNRIRFDPEADELRAFGMPVVVESGGKRSEGGEVAIALDADQWDILAGPTRRTETTLRVRPR